MPMSQELALLPGSTITPPIFQGLVLLPGSADGRDTVCGDQDLSTPTFQGPALSQGSTITLKFSLSSLSFGSTRNDVATRSIKEGIAPNAVRDKLEQTNNDSKTDRKRERQQCIEQTTLDYAANLKTLRLIKGSSAKKKKGYLAKLITEQMKEYDVFEAITENIIQTSAKCRRRRGAPPFLSSSREKYSSRSVESKKLK